MSKIGSVYWKGMCRQHSEDCTNQLFHINPILKKFNIAMMIHDYNFPIGLLSI